MRKIEKLMMAAVLAGAGLAGAAVKPEAQGTDQELTRKVVHEIRMYDRYTLWDNVNVKVEGGHVELLGQVSQPFKKTDLGRIAERVAGVTGVTNQLAVLPLSHFDDVLRLQVARALFSDPTLSRYSMQAVPPIHIIVDNGRVTLEGVVNSDMEKQLAGLRANTAGMSFGQVTNNLRVENPRPTKG